MRKFESQQFYPTHSGQKNDDEETSANGSDHDTITSLQGKLTSV